MVACTARAATFAIAALLAVSACESGVMPDSTASTTSLAAPSSPAPSTSVPSTTDGPVDTSTSAPALSTTTFQPGLTTMAAIGCVQPALDPRDLAVVVYQGCGNPNADGTNDDLPTPLLRGVEPTTRPMLAAFTALFAGPTAEESDAGYRSWFGPETADLPFEVWIDPGGAAVLDLSPAFPEVIDNNVTTSSGGLFFISQLFGTAFAFDSVETFEVRLDGDVVRFCAWFAFIPDCTPIDRAEWLAHYTES